jgi:hypothetical protein
MTSKGVAILALGVAALVILGGAGAILLTREDAATGRIAIYVKDAPAEWSHVNVTFSKVMIHQAGSGDDNETGDNDTADGGSGQNETDSGEWITISLDTQTVDLKAYVNISALLASGNISVGKYTQIRIVVDSVVGTLVNGTQVEFKVPSGTLKINKPFTIKKDQITDLTVDIDLSKSIVENPNGWIFKPVLGSIVVG